MSVTLTKWLFPDVKALTIVGRDRQQYFIHEEAFSAISPVLAAIITGRVHEAHEGVAVWDDIDERDFLNLCEFAYSGNYTAPPMEQAPRPKRLYNTLQGKAATIYGYSAARDSLLTMQTSRPDLRASILAFFEEYRKLLGLTVPSKIIGSRIQGLTEHLLCHAHVYILADRYDVKQLRRLSLFKLLEIDELRELVSSFVAFKSQLFVHPDMEALRKNNPKFASDIFAHTLKYSRHQLTYWKAPENGSGEHLQQGAAKRPRVDGAE
ncbi:hypothetical protein F5Y06DRAFT_295903 [Hypoxylon sp. FL0890]|nr:hypothetical protein F5Y06DRAFT_295903 [Hypoxylon sp. FL0890]